MVGHGCEGGEEAGRGQAVPGRGLAGKWRGWAGSEGGGEGGGRWSFPRFASLVQREAAGQGWGVGVRWRHGRDRRMLRPAGLEGVSAALWALESGCDRGALPSSLR